MIQNQFHALLQLRDRRRRQRTFRPPGRTTRFFIMLAGVPARLGEAVALWRQSSRDRRWLANLDDRMLRDMGLDRDEVEQESPTWFGRLR
jgi:uncharacterized protein YjiS (DUF1127 family)